MNKDTEKRVKAFVERWRGRGYEKGESQPFWLDLLQTVQGVERPYDIVSFENQVKLSSTSFIDAYIEPTHTLIEQKSIDKDLRKPIPQSDGSLLKPFEQAKRYNNELPYSKRARWMVICNFKEFHVYDMENPHSEPEVILLENLEKEYYRLRFLTETKDVHLQKELEVSMKAGDIIGEIYDELLKEYRNPDSDETLKSLNVLCVRLVFCLYAEDAGIFGKHDMFHDYLVKYKPGEGDMRRALIDLFRVLNTPESERDPYLNDDLLAFPYCNGGLFADETVEIPRFNDKIAHLLLQNASLDFDWSQISPTIFGAVFESTLNPETRRSGGMHYTSIKNIHKVIDPLFLDDLRQEFESIKEERLERTRRTHLDAFHDKLASLTFLDPACGSGNFLTETYLSLRRLENEVILEKSKGESFLGFENPIKVDIHQFYGIEINDFAVSTATTALWIAESQMMSETEKIIHKDLDMLPLKSYHNIHEGNALRMDWNDVIPASELSYIMGNPPFVGYSLQSKEQKEDILSVLVDEKGKPYKTAGKIDYVASWYYKCSKYIQGTNIRCALVSTNSITQGEQIAAIWKPLFEQFGIHFDFTYRTFRWDSEANLKAHVHCVIVGFSVAPNNKPKYIYQGDQKKEAKNINGYLLDTNNIFVTSRNTTLCDVPNMITGNRPADGGALIIEAKDYDEFITKEPNSKKYIKRLYGAEEFINNKVRWCLWLTDASPSEIRNMPLVYDRIVSCRNARLQGALDRQKLADTPHLFRETNNPDTYIIIPSTSSERRRYVPMGFLDKNTISTNANLIIPDANLYHFGILTSNVHMAWMRAVCGRLEMRYRYSKDIVYNNFPWPTPTDEQKAKIEQTAQAILDARALYPDSSLADLYDEVAMPPELRKAHQQNDRAVMEAYGFPVSRDFTESDCVAELFKMYQILTGDN